MFRQKQHSKSQRKFKEQLNGVKFKVTQKGAIHEVGNLGNSAPECSPSQYKSFKKKITGLKTWSNSILFGSSSLRSTGSSLSSSRSSSYSKYDRTHSFKSSSGSSSGSSRISLNNWPKRRKPFSQIGLPKGQEIKMVEVVVPIEIPGWGDCGDIKTSRYKSSFKTSITQKKEKSTGNKKSNVLAWIRRH